VIADVTAAVDTCSAAAIGGSEGNKMLVASVPSAANPASTAIWETAAACSPGVTLIVELASSITGVPDL
jgi:hypothetical protein